MNIYGKAATTLKQKYDIDILEQIVLARNDRAIYYVEYNENDIIFNKIHGKSPMDLLPDNTSFVFSELEKMFFMDSKYGEVAGKKYYRDLNLNMIKNMETEANVTIPVMIQHQLFWVRLHLYKTLSGQDGTTTLASCYITDVTKYLIHEELLYEKTHKDELTGLFNRYALYYHFELHGNRAPITSFYFDIDNFKTFNDKYGHDIGDEVLVQFSNRLKALADDSFFSYRLGGDEFYCLLFGKNLEEAKKHVEKIKESISYVEINNVTEKLSVSIGVVQSKDDITHKMELFMKEADRLMYISKKNGKNTATYGEFVVFK